MTAYAGSERAHRNDESRNSAEHHREAWEHFEIDLLLGWDGTEAELADVSEMLGRTIEACRQEYYIARRYGNRGRVRSVTTTTTHTTTVRWADDDEWPEWYVRG